MTEKPPLPPMDPMSEEQKMSLHFMRYLKDLSPESPDLARIHVCFCICAVLIEKCTGKEDLLGALEGLKQTVMEEGS
jgi:hypothetical protein